jgi:hypothetical protein
MKKARPYIETSNEFLERLIEVPQTPPETLALIADELGHRSTGSARNLLLKVQARRNREADEFLQNFVKTAHAQIVSPVEPVSSNTGSSEHAEVQTDATEKSEGNCESTEIQAAFDVLKRQTREQHAHWKNSRNEWIRYLNRDEIGRIGEELCVAIIGGDRTETNKAGYDIELGNMKIEVKTCSMRWSDGSPLIVWQQIRFTDPFTHLCLILIEPENVRMFLVARNSIPYDELGRSHGTKSKMYEIVARNLRKRHPWLLEHEVLRRTK